MKKTFRITLDPNICPEEVSLIERCPRPLRGELIVMALKLLNQKKEQIISESNNSNSERIKEISHDSATAKQEKPTKEQIEQNEPSIDFSKIF